MKIPPKYYKHPVNGLTEPWEGSVNEIFNVQLSCLHVTFILHSIQSTTTSLVLFSGILTNLETVVVLSRRDHSTLTGLHILVLYIILDNDGESFRAFFLVLFFFLSFLGR